MIEVGAPVATRVYLRRLWERRDFILHVPLGKLRAQTHGTVIGAGWHVLNPMLHGVVYYLLFGVIFSARRAIENYPAFLLIGLFTFLFTIRSVLAGARSITANTSLLQQISFPRMALPISGIVAEAISHALALIPLLAIVIVFGEPLSASWLAFPIVVLLQTVFCLGLALIAARTVFVFRDVEKLLPHLLRFWMYLSGLFFTLDFVVGASDGHEAVTTIFQLNPGYIFMALARGTLLGAQPLEMWMWVAGLLWALSMFVVGFLFFRGGESDYGRT